MPVLLYAKILLLDSIVAYFERKMTVQLQSVGLAGTNIFCLTDIQLGKNNFLKYLQVLQR